MPAGKKIVYLAQGAVIAALYAILTLILPLSLPGTVELRLSEALTLLPALTPAAIPGLTVGCLIANLMHGAVALDVIFGTLATLLAALAVYFLRDRLYLAAAMPALFNGAIIGPLLTYAYMSLPVYLSVPAVAAGELVICYALGLPLIKGLKKTKIF